MRLFNKSLADSSPQLVSAISIEYDDALSATNKISNDVSLLQKNDLMSTKNLRKEFSTWGKKVGRKWQQLRKVDSTELLAVPGRRRHWSPNRETFGEDEIKEKNSTTSPKPKKLLRVESLRNLFKLSERSNSAKNVEYPSNSRSNDYDESLDMNLYKMNKTLSDSALRNISKVRHAVEKPKSLYERKDHLNRVISNLQKQQKVLDYFLDNEYIIKTKEGSDLARKALAQLDKHAKVQRRISTEKLHANDVNSNKLFQHVKRNLFSGRIHNSAKYSVKRRSFAAPGIEDLLGSLRLGCDESGYDTDSTRAGADSPDDEQLLSTKSRSLSITSEELKGIDLSLENTSQRSNSSINVDNQTSTDTNTINQLDKTLETSNRTDTTIVLEDDDTDSCDDEKFESFINSRIDLRVVENPTPKKKQKLSKSKDISKSTFNLSESQSKIDNQTLFPNLSTKLKKRSLPLLDDSTFLKHNMKLKSFQDNVMSQVKSKSMKLEYSCVSNLLDYAASPNKDSPPATKIKPNVPSTDTIQYYSPKRSRSKMEADSPDNSIFNRAKRPTFKMPHSTSKLPNFQANREMKTINIFVEPSSYLGITVERRESAKPFFVISKLDPNGAAAKCEKISIGDEIVRVCGRRLRGMSLLEAKNALKNCVGNVELQITQEPTFIIRDDEDVQWGDPLVRTRSDSDVWKLKDSRHSDRSLQLLFQSSSNLKSDNTGEVDKIEKSNSMSAEDTQQKASQVTGMRKFQVIKKRIFNSNPAIRQSGNYSMELLTVTLEKGAAKKLGFSIVGGSDSSKGNMGIFIKEISADGQAAANGVMRAGDEILAINGQSVNGFTHARALQVFKAAKAGNIVIQIGRRDLLHRRHNS